MKRNLFLSILIFIAAILLIFGSRILYHRYKKQTQTPISIIIASDIHYLSPEYRGEYFKEPSEIFDGKLIHYSPEYFDAFLAEVMEQKPEALILSGDITLNGSLKSHEDVIKKLETVQAAGTQVLVIPGNHDVNSVSGDYTPAEPIVVESATSEAFMKMYENFGPSQALSRDELTFSYIYEASPYLRVLMIDTNSLSKGFVSDATLNWIETQLKDAKRIGADVIAVSHQNLHIHNELFSFGYQLYNASDLLALYEKYNVKLNLSGHIHVQSIVSDETTPGTKVPDISIGSLAVCGTPYGELNYDGKTITYQTRKTDVSSYAAAQGWSNEDLSDFNNYSYWYFEEVSRLQTFSKYTQSELSPEEIYLLANTFAKINSSYFLGETIDTNALSDGIELWGKQEGTFVNKYIESMLLENDVDNQTLIIK